MPKESTPTPANKLKTNSDNNTRSVGGETRSKAVLSNGGGTQTKATISNGDVKTVDHNKPQVRCYY